MTEPQAPTDAEFAAEYQRIGYRPGEQWPTPPCGMPSTRIIQLLRQVPTGAGLAGWMEVLARQGRGAHS
jgi:hypothetical protein